MHNMQVWHDSILSTELQVGRQVGERRRFNQVLLAAGARDYNEKWAKKPGAT